MATIAFDRNAVTTAMDQVAGRLIAMVSAAPDPTVTVPATPAWTVAEAFAHVSTVVPRYSQGARQQGEWVQQADALADLNSRQLAVEPTDLAALIERIRASLAEVTALITDFGDTQPVFTFHGGQPVGADVALGILLGELVVHGHDIATALNERWPINPDHVELIIQGLTPILPGWLDTAHVAGHTARYEVHLRGQGVHRFAFDNGRLTMNPAWWSRPDAYISADPAAFLLIVYKRLNQWPAILTGRLAAWGRRPWLALSLAGRFHQP